jgi:hypothetical protein
MFIVFAYRILRYIHTHTVTHVTSTIVHRTSVPKRQSAKAKEQSANPIVACAMCGSVAVRMHVAIAIISIFVFGR